MPPKNSGGSTKFPGGHKVIHRTAQTAFVRACEERGKETPATTLLFSPNYFLKLICKDETTANCLAVE